MFIFVTHCVKEVTKLVCNPPTIYLRLLVEHKRSGKFLMEVKGQVLLLIGQI